MNRALFKTAAALLAAAILGAGCTFQRPNPNPYPQIPSITVKGGDFNFEVPPQMQAGLVSIAFENIGQEVHHLQLVQLKDGVTFEQFLAELPKGDASMLALLQGIVGGVGPLDPGGSGRVTMELKAGTYVWLCVLPSHDGVPHLAKGMIAPFIVKGDAPAGQAKPIADGVVRFKDFAFELPAEIKAGPQAWQVFNDGPQTHEIALIKLAEGATLDDVLAFDETAHDAGAPPYQNIGGFQGIDPGKTGWLHLDLEPGTYVAICHIPDPASGKSHSELGMVQTFTVK
jgi:uncharacterized cupredoxin-like copper-binding protein